MNQIKLPLTKLKEFTDLSKNIIDNDKMSIIYQYIKIEIDFGKCTLTKSSGNSFLIFDFPIDIEDCSFIIHEKVLSDFVNSTGEQYIYIQLAIDKNIHIIKDSLNKKCYEKTFNDGGYKIKDFPSSHISLDSLDYTRLNKSLIDSINRAKSFVGKDDLAPMYNHIFISEINGDCYISSFGGQTMYMDKLGSILPTIAISPREQTVITKFDWLDYCCCENFNVYKYNNVIYGFAQIDGAKPVDLSMPLRMFKKENYFTIKTNDLIKFCTSIKLYSGTADKDREDSKWKNSSLVNDFGECTLFFEMEKISESIKVICDVKVFGQEFNFNFNQNLLYEIVRSFAFEEINISDSGNGVCLFSPLHENMIGFMMKYVSNQLKN